MLDLNNKIKVRADLTNKLGRKPTNEEFMQALRENDELVKNNNDLLGLPNFSLERPEEPKIIEKKQESFNPETEKLLGLKPFSLERPDENDAFGLGLNTNKMEFKPEETEAFTASVPKKQSVTSNITTPKTNTKPASDSKMESDKEDSLKDTEFEQALAQTQQNKGSAMLMAALGKLGTAIANKGSVGGGIQDNFKDTADTLAKQAEDPIRMLETKREQFAKLISNKEQKELADPNSAVSKAARDLIKDMGGNVADTATAMQLKNVLPYLQQKFAVEEARKNRAMQMELMKQNKIEKQEDKDLMFAKALEDKIQGLDAVKSFSQTEIASNTLDQIASLPPNKQNAQQQVAALYSFVKILDPNSVVREGEIQLTQAARSIPDTIKVKLQKVNANQGAVLTPQEIRSIAEYARQVKDNYANAAKAASRNYLELAKSKNVDKYLNHSFNTIEKPEQNVVQSKTIVKKQYSKSADKTKFIYADGTEEIVDGRK